MRTPFFFEYPSVVVMLLHEVRYGIAVGVANVSVAPLRRKDAGTAAFVYAAGTTTVAYSRDAVAVAAPGACLAGKGYRFEGLTPGARFVVTLAGAATGSGDGAAPAGAQVVGADGTLAFALAPAPAPGTGRGGRSSGSGAIGSADSCSVSAIAEHNKADES